jgi:putative nucleotidyltransferase with HDIG domain
MIPMEVSIEQFKKQLMEIKEISTLPQVMARIMEIITDESSCAADLADEIMKDKSLTAKILKMVNSAYYGFYREIVRVSDAVVVLGFNEIRRLSLAISVLDILGRSKRSEIRLRLWNHSLACAALSDILTKEWRLNEGGAFTAGLLHDIGKAVLDQYFPSMFAAVQASMLKNSLKANEAERLLWNFDHADIGFWLCERWNLPLSLSEAIRYHHRPESSEGVSPLAKIVHVADNFANEFMELKTAGIPVTEASFVDDGEFSPEKKVRLFRELEKRVKSSTAVDILR